MSNRKGLLSLLLVAAIIGTLFIGCQNEAPGTESPSGDTVPSEQQTSEAVPEYLNPTGFPIVKQPITVKMMGSKNVNHGPWDKMLVFQEYEKKTGIHVEWDTPATDAYADRKNLILASGDMPDAFLRGELTTQDILMYGSQQNVLLPLDDLIDKYAPNIKNAFEKYPDARKTITALDGKIYTIPQIQPTTAAMINDFLWINKNWLDALGLKMPTTTDEYYEVLKAFKGRDPNGNGKADEIPYGDNKEDGPFNLFMGYWGLGNNEESNFDLDKNGDMRFVPADERYKEMLEFCNKLYKEGLMDKEIFTTDRAQAMAKAAQGILGSFIEPNPDSQGIKADKIGDYVGAPCLKSPHGDPVYSTVNPMVSKRDVGMFAITNKSKYPEAIMRWVDYFYSEEGSAFMSLGVKGVTYEDGPDASFQWKDVITKNPDGLTMNQAIGQFMPIPGGGAPRIVLDKWDLMPRTAPNAKAARALVEPYIPKEIWPTFFFTPEEQDRLSALQTDIDTYVNEMAVKFTTGVEPFSSWDKYLNTLKQMGLDEYIKIYKTAYERWKNS